MENSPFTTIDYIVVVLYLLLVVVAGSWMGKGQSTVSEYFLAGRNMNWLVVCISVAATDLSAISFTGVPAWLYAKDLKYSMGVFLLPFILLFVLFYFVRVFHQLKVFTTYEYLEHRFHPVARTITSVLFLGQRGAWLATAIYAPSLALATVSGFPVLGCIVTVGFLATLYTVLGGMKAVVWTDFVQFIVLAGGLLLMIGLLMSFFSWDAGAVWNRAGELTAPATGGPHTRLFDWSLDLSTEATVWSLLFFMSVYLVGTQGTDQVTVQRYLTVGSFRSMAKSVMGSGFVIMGMILLLAWLGLLLVVYYDRHPELAAQVTRPDMIVPHFVANVLPVGIRGLILAALLAATMSSVDSALNSFATVGVMDLYRRHFPKRADEESQLLRMGRLITLIAGALATLAAVGVSSMQSTVIQTVHSLASTFVGPITGMFFLGVLTSRVRVQSMLVGAFAGLVTSVTVAWTPLGQDINWMWTAPSSSIVTFLTGYTLSLVLDRPGRARC